MTQTHLFPITIDTVEYSVAEHELTAAAIIRLAGKDPDAYYLVGVLGKRERKSYKDEPGAIVHLHKHSEFVLVSTGPTPLS